ncbi:M23 family metallopeptidase [Neogemmobacter tilapiae]|uniref:Peptidase M23 n=1 Tax=Neogemmobacter tilapiae TaxID=875041 RepID=A0A918TI77_9RHOB|nr:M23 family metallopeptidase [Gemmobacter tilapiae]GHC47261.1 peptidase M23 [Gemmobacter tilapiae]
MRLMLALSLFALPAQAFDLGFPVDCTLGETCFIQQFSDHDPGPAATDFTCGTLAYDGHDGTDFALPSLAAMEAGVNVLAAAEGVVLGVRDGMADVLVTDANRPEIAGRECGNGVVLGHPGGWQTQYCHMKQGSLNVGKGETVEQGQILGQVGLSGETQFPHVHLSVRRGDKKIDPFAPEDQARCGAAQATLWEEPITYQAGGIIAAGYADHLPEFEAIKAGMTVPDALLPDASAMVAWAYVFGAQAGDELHHATTTAEGDMLIDFFPLEKTQAQLYRAFGKKLSAGGWPPGTYTTVFTLMRDGVEIDSATATVTVLP